MCAVSSYFQRCLARCQAQQHDPASMPVFNWMLCSASALHVGLLSALGGLPPSGGQARARPQIYPLEGCIRSQKTVIGTHLRPGIAATLEGIYTASRVGALPGPHWATAAASPTTSNIHLSVTYNNIFSSCNCKSHSMDEQAARRLRSIASHVAPPSDHAASTSSPASAPASQQPLRAQPTASSSSSNATATGAPSTYDRVHGEVSRAPPSWRRIPVVAREELREVIYEKAEGEGIAKVGMGWVGGWEDGAGRELLLASGAAAAVAHAAGWQAARADVPLACTHSSKPQLIALPPPPTTAR